MEPKDLRRQRMALRISQAQLADALNISVKTVSRWENGHNKIPRCADLAIRYLLLNNHPSSVKSEKIIKDAQAWHAWNMTHSI